jgi:hypothetical protein
MPLAAELEALCDEEPLPEMPRPLLLGDVFMLVPGMVVPPPGGFIMLLPLDVAPIPTPGVIAPPVAGIPLPPMPVVIPLPPMPVVMPLPPMLLPLLDGSKPLPAMPVADEVNGVLVAPVPLEVWLASDLLFQPCERPLVTPRLPSALPPM